MFLYGLVCHRGISDPYSRAGGNGRSVIQITLNGGSSVTKTKTPPVAQGDFLIGTLSGFPGDQFRDRNILEIARTDIKAGDIDPGIFLG